MEAGNTLSPSKIVNKFLSFVLSPTSNQSSRRLSDIIEINCFSIKSLAKQLSIYFPRLAKLGVLNYDKLKKQDLSQVLNHPVIRDVGISVTQESGFSSFTHQHLWKIKEQHIQISTLQYLHETIQHLPRLEKLTIKAPNYHQRINLTAELASLLKPFGELRELCLYYFTIVSKRSINEIALCLPQLQIISLKQCPSITCEEDVSVELPDKLRQIHLELDPYTISFVLELVKAASKRAIRMFLTIDKKCQASGQFWDDLVQESHFNLIGLNFQMVQTDILRKLIVQRPNNMETLRLTNQLLIQLQQQTQIGGVCQVSFFKQLLDTQQHLKELNLAFCKNLKNRAVILISQLQYLQKLVLSFCRLRFKGMIYLKKLKRLRVLQCFSNQTPDSGSVNLMASLQRIAGQISIREKKHKENFHQLRFFTL